jgi:RNA polymerase sigma factor (sigma-70 family)
LERLGGGALGEGLSYWWEQFDEDSFVDEVSVEEADDAGVAAAAEVVEDEAKLEELLYPSRGILPPEKIQAKTEGIPGLEPIEIAIVGARKMAGPDGKEFVLERGSAGVSLLNYFLTHRDEPETVKRLREILASDGVSTKTDGGIHAHLSDMKDFLPHGIFLLEMTSGRQRKYRISPRIEFVDKRSEIEEQEKVEREAAKALREQQRAVLKAEREAGRVPRERRVLTEEEKAEQKRIRNEQMKAANAALSERLAAGDESVRSGFIDNNLGLAWGMAHWAKARSPEIDIEDFYQEGAMGLVKAAQTYTPDKGEFAAYANTCIFNAVGMFLRTDPRRKAIKQGQAVLLSLDMPIASSGDNDRELLLVDTIEDEEAGSEFLKVEEDGLAVDLIERAGLTEVERRMTELYYGLNGEKPHAHKEIGDMEEFNFSQSYVSRICTRALKKLVCAARESGIDSRF